MEPPLKMKWGPKKLRDWLNHLLAYCISNKPLKGHNIDTQQGPNGVMISSQAGGGSAAAASSECRFGIVDAREQDDDGEPTGEKKVRVLIGFLNGQYPSGFTAGDDPPYLVNVTGMHYFYAKATGNTTTLQWTSREILVSPTATVPNTTEVGYWLFGSVNATGDDMIIDRTCGDIAIDFCDLVDPT